MNKIFFVIFSLSILVLSAFLLWYFFLRAEAPVPGSPTSTGLPIASQNTNVLPRSEPTQSQWISLATSDEGTMAVLDFLNDPETVVDPNNSDYYNLGYLVDTSPYLITYIASTQYFNIVLLREPIGETRERAEQYLMQHLSISAADLCKLDYTISTPTFVNSQYGGINLGFSFCPGATVLPK